MKAALIVRRQPPREVALSLTSRSRPQSIAPVYISGDTICPPRRAGPCLPNFLQLSSLSKQGFQSWKGSETHTNDGARRARRAISKFIWLRGEALGVLSALGSEVSQPPPQRERLLLAPAGPCLGTGSTGSCWGSLGPSPWGVLDPRTQHGHRQPPAGPQHFPGWVVFSSALFRGDMGAPGREMLTQHPAKPRKPISPSGWDAGLGLLMRSDASFHPSL